MIKVLNSQDGVQVVETKELAHGGIRIPEKQLHTIPKPFSFESRKSCAVKPKPEVNFNFLFVLIVMKS